MQTQSKLIWFAAITMSCLFAVACQRGAEGEGSPPQNANDVSEEQGTPNDREPGSEGGGAMTVSEERAVELARELAAQEGYDLSVYELAGAELNEEGSSYWVNFEHAPPTPPGGHFSISVDVSTGEARLHRGE